VNLLIGSLTIGFILALLSLGVYISFRIFDFPDITTDGSITLGAAVAAVLLVRGAHPAAASLAAMIAGMAAGMVTGILHTRFNIHRLLSGILVMTALYSVNLHIMGRSNVPLLDQQTLLSMAGDAAAALAGGRETVNLIGWNTAIADLATLITAALIIALIALTLYLFLRTNLGTAMRATGNNDQMIRALNVNTKTMIVAGLALANGLIALGGALLAQYQGFADVQMGIGMVVWGLASVIIGEALVRTSSLALTLCGAVMGSILFRLLVAIALRWGLNPNDLKLITAVFVFAALILPGTLAGMRARIRRHTPGKADQHA
jgi:putative tryptophan/tyrosine transport system permease protein